MVSSCGFNSDFNSCTSFFGRAGCVRNANVANENKVKPAMHNAESSEENTAASFLPSQNTLLALKNVLGATGGHTTALSHGPQRIFQCYCFHQYTCLGMGSCKMGAEDLGYWISTPPVRCNRRGSQAYFFALVVRGHVTQSEFGGKSNFVGICIQCHYFFGCMHLETHWPQPVDVTSVKMSLRQSIDISHLV